MQRPPLWLATGFGTSSHQVFSRKSARIAVNDRGGAVLASPGPVVVADRTCVRLVAGELHSENSGAIHLTDKRPLRFLLLGTVRDVRPSVGRYAMCRGSRQSVQGCPGFPDRNPGALRFLTSAGNVLMIPTSLVWWLWRGEGFPDRVPKHSYSPARCGALALVYVLKRRRRQ